METTCPRCKAAIRPDDRFCPSCGQVLAPAAETGSAHPAALDKAAGMASQAPGRKPWYRRWRVVVPLVLVAMIVFTLGAGAWYIKTRFDTLNELTTPPAEISGDRLGGDEELTIDTGPAQDAVREAEARREAARNSPPPTTGVEQAAVEETTGAQGDGLDTGAPGTEVAEPAGAGTGESANETSAPSRRTAEASVAGTAVVEINPAGTPVLVSEPVGTPALAAAPEPVERDSYAFLMMGVDARPGEAIDVGVRPDSLFVVYLDGSSGSCRVLSIPRDTRTTLPGYGQSKINHALAVGGVPYERLVVENLLGIELEHYGLIDFSGIEKLVDAVGGITVDNSYAFSTLGHTFPEGRIRLNGEEALLYSRFRQDERGDFGRQERQQAVVRALLTQGAGMDVVTAIPSLLEAVEDHVRTDLGPGRMVDIAQEFRSTCTGDTLETSRIEGTVAWAYDDLMQMELSFVLVDPAEVERKVHWLLTGDDEPAAEEQSAPVGTPPARPVAEGDEQASE